jgi:predicted HTH transcriptional regulator
MMDNSEITRRFNLDHLIVPKLINVDSKEQDLSFKDSLFLYHQKGKDVKNEKVFLRNKHFMTESGKYNRLADLFADVNHLSLLFCRFDGKTKEFPVQRVEYGKQNLIIGSKKVLDYARDIINTTQIKITGEAEREELRLFDDKSFREGWLNAIQYTDYLHESYPRVFAFSDRIEIESYGGLPKGLSLDEFFEGTHYSVSPELTEILMELDHIEHIGHVVPYIVSKYGKETFHISDHTVKVIIPFRYLDNSILQNIPIVEQPSLTADQIKIIDYIKQNGSIRRSEVETLLDVKERTANKILREMVEIRIILMHKKTKSAVYTIYTQI